jgi:glycosyltransferase involved in cell wall biosynthesis
MVVLESLVLGVPVVAPRFGPFPYAIEHDVNGLLFEPGSSEALCRSLAQITARDGALDRLRHGAIESGQRLLAAHRGFASAVDSTFALATGHD